MLLKRYWFRVLEIFKVKTSKLNLSQNGEIFRTKANCLRICQKGPIAVVYPDAVWYHSCTQSVLEKIITEHLVKGKIVTEYVLFQDNEHDPHDN